MKTLLFIGNSHLAAVKSAWDAAPPAGYAAEFFGAPQRAWQKMALLPGNQFGLTPGGDYKRQREITEQANGISAISLDARNIVIMVGAFSAADPMATLLATCDIPDLRETGAPTLLSEPLFARACASMAAACLPEPGWLNRHDLTLATQPRPAPADRCMTSSHAQYQSWHALAQTPAGVPDAFALFDAALTDTMAAKGITYLPQPPATRTAPGLTPARFLADGGGTKPGQEQRRGDHAHMNAAYGTACVAHILTWLTSQS